MEKHASFLFSAMASSTSSIYFQSSETRTNPFYNPAAAKMEDVSSNYDRAKEVKEFDETKAGVKGLVDSGITKIPRFLVHSPESLENYYSTTASRELKVPVIDFNGFDCNFRREQVVEEIREASQKWGFFQMLNHGVPESVIDNLLEAIRRFHEQPKEVKMEWYSRDTKQKVRYYCNGDLLVSKAANWRDSIGFGFQDGPLDSQTMPLVCREPVQEYMKHLTNLRDILSGLLSEALGLSSDYLEGIGCMKTETLVCHYYPSCPEPELTLGATKHSDPSSLTMLLQDNLGGLQVLHQGHWVAVPPVHGALVANIGDLMQLITNDKFKSVEHRVLAGRVGPRVSAACFFYPSATQRFKPYGPITEILSDNLPIYRETHIEEYLAYYRSKGLDGKSALPHFKLP